MLPPNGKAVAGEVLTLDHPARASAEVEPNGYRRKCGDCRFHAPGRQGLAGECRRNPPLVMVMQGQGLAAGQVKVAFQSYFPPAAGDSWCGAWEQRPGELK